jgi:hypothetical protein
MEEYSTRFRREEMLCTQTRESGEGNVLCKSKHETIITARMVFILVSGLE